MSETPEAFAARMERQVNYLLERELGPDRDRWPTVAHELIAVVKRGARPTGSEPSVDSVSDADAERSAGRVVDPPR